MATTADPGGLTVTEVAPGLHRLALPLGIHGVSTVSAYLLAGGSGGSGRADTLVDCGVAAAVTADGDPGPDGTAALEAALTACGSGFELIERLVVTHAHIDHFGLAGEVVRRSGGQLWMHRSTELDLAKYADPDEAVDRRELMLADHGLYGPDLTDTSRGLCDWLPVMPSIGRPSTLLDGGERFTVGDRTWEVVHTPGHSPGHVCLWTAADRLLCSGDHLLQLVSPPVTFERGFETDPMGSYLASLERVRALEPELTLPGHGAPFPGGARRAASISRNKLRRLGQIREMVEARERTVTELTTELFPTVTTGAQRHFAMAEILAFLAHHEVRGVLERRRRADGVYVWRAQGS
jgi:glyoxylase-like metal-dependent hydrolase (beta-lactamase superfamily II)